MENFSYSKKLMKLGLCLLTSSLFMHSPALYAAEDEANSADDQDIASEKVPCTKSNPQLGERLCKDVEADAVNVVKKGVGHIIGNYYEGKLLSFYEPVSKDEVSRGFCLEKNLPQEATVCALTDANSPEFEKNWNNQRCGGKFPSNLTRSPVDSSDDGYCQISVDGGVNVNTCAKEKDWFERGGQVQAWQHYLEEVVDEIQNNGEVSLVNYAQDGEAPSRPCLGFAKQINRVLGVHGEKESILAVEARIRRDFPAEELSTELSAACLKEGTDKSLVKAKAGSLLDRAIASISFGGNGSKQASNNSLDKAAANTNVFDKALVMNTDDVEISKKAFDKSKGILRENKTLSQAACHLAFARRHLETLFFKLAACEVVHRAKKAYYDNFQSFDLALAPLTEQVISPCIGYAQGQDDSENFMKNFYQCYKGEVPGKKGVKDFFVNYMKDKGLTTREPASHEKIGEDPSLKSCGAEEGNHS